MCALVELLRKVTVYRVLQKVCLVIDGNGGGVGEANAFVRGRQVLKNKSLRRQRHSTCTVENQPRADFREFVSV